jgi:hypothetical protein
MNGVVSSAVDVVVVYRKTVILVLSAEMREREGLRVDPRGVHGALRETKGDFGWGEANVSVHGDCALMRPIYAVCMGAVSVKTNHPRYSASRTSREHRIVPTKNYCRRLHSDR